MQHTHTHVRMHAPLSIGRIVIFLSLFVGQPRGSTQITIINAQEKNRKKKHTHKTRGREREGGREGAWRPLYAPTYGKNPTNKQPTMPFCRYLDTTHQKYNKTQENVSMASSPPDAIELDPPPASGGRSGSGPPAPSSSSLSPPKEREREKGGVKKSKGSRVKEFHI